MVGVYLTIQEENCVSVTVITIITTALPTKPLRSCFSH
jgi:hypothetical protein